MYVHTCNIEQFGHETSNESLFITRRWCGVYASIFHREKFTDPRGEAGGKGAKVRDTPCSGCKYEEVRCYAQTSVTTHLAWNGSASENLGKPPAPRSSNPKGGADDGCARRAGGPGRPALPSDPGKPGRRSPQKDSPGEGKEEREQGAGAADSVSLSPDRDASKKAR